MMIDDNNSDVDYRMSDDGYMIIDDVDWWRLIIDDVEWWWLWWWLHDGVDDDYMMIDDDDW